nr:GNAT family N-acetyltransferase [Aestuariivivens insulae]
MAFEENNNQFVQQYSFAEHKEVLEKESHLSVFESKSNLLIGFVILAGVFSSDKIIEFRRIVISKKGFGYGKETVQLVKKICFEDYKANKIWLDVYTNNERAIKLYKSMGFIEEGLESTEKSRTLLIMSITNNSITINQ